jgi:uncharacterized protein
MHYSTDARMPENPSIAMNSSTLKIIMNFSAMTKRHLGHYVYGLVDPINKAIFYVGKASANNRAFDHLKATEDEREKQTRIRQIRTAGLEPSVEILRYGLPSTEACFEVEAAIIDAIGLENLTNAVRGHGVERGRLSAFEAERLHGSKPFQVEALTERYMMFFINKTYSPTKTEQQLYDSVRQFWYRVSAQTRTPNAASSELPYSVALGVVDSVVVRVYSMAAWFPAGTTFSSRDYVTSPVEERWEFVGNLLSEHVLLGRRLTKDGKDLVANQQGFGYIN